MGKVQLLNAACSRPGLKNSSNQHVLARISITQRSHILSFLFSSATPRFAKVELHQNADKNEFGRHRSGECILDDIRVSRLAHGCLIITKSSILLGEFYMKDSGARTATQSSTMPVSTSCKVLVVASANIRSQARYPRYSLACI